MCCFKATNVKIWYGSHRTLVSHVSDPMLTLGLYEHWTLSVTTQGIPLPQLSGWGLKRVGNKVCARWCWALMPSKTSISQVFRHPINCEWWCPIEQMGSRRSCYLPSSYRKWQSQD